MLIVPTFIDRSAVSGMGVFAQELIPKGTIIWIYNSVIDQTFSESEWQQLEKQLHAHSFQSIKKYSYKERGKYILCNDNAQFMNHSDSDFNISNSSDLNSMFATRDIEMGEELLCNYLEYSDEDDHHIKYLYS